MALIQIMRAGRFTAVSGKEVEFTDDDLLFSALAYSPQRRAAVLTLG